MNGVAWKEHIGLVDELGQPISPATEQKQDDIIAALGGIASPTSIGSGTRVVTTAGTRVQLSALSVPCKRVHIRTKSDNTNYIYVGGSSVSSTSGVYLNTTDSFTLNISNLNAVYIDSAVNGEGVMFTYEA